MGTKYGTNIRKLVECSNVNNRPGDCRCMNDYEGR